MLSTATSIAAAVFLIAEVSAAWRRGVDRSPTTAVSRKGGAHHNRHVRLVGHVATHIAATASPFISNSWFCWALSAATGWRRRSALPHWCSRRFTCCGSTSG